LTIFLGVADLPEWADDDTRVWVSFEFNVPNSTCGCYSLINTLEFEKMAVMRSTTKKHRRNNTDLLWLIA